MPATVVGLDIGRCAVRAVELRRSGRTPVVRRSGSVAVPHGAVEGGVVRDPAAVTDALKRLWREQRIQSRQVRLGVCSGSVLVRHLELDWMPPQDLRRALRYQVADLLPVAVDDANLDHVLLGEQLRTNPQTGTERRVVEILLVATARGNVDDLVRCVQAAGLRPVTADLSPLALVRAAASRTGAGDLTEAVVDVGADTVSVAVHVAGMPRFVRVAAGVGGELLTRALVDELGWTWQEAEAAKRADAATLPEPARHALEAASARLVGEIRASLDFHAATDPLHVPVRALVTGGGAAHAGFAARCSAALGMPVELLDPTTVARVTPLPDEDLSVSLGLCLGETA
ncbi:pilus assembly protein PilM [Nocardioides psychrotolerans]|uniref:Type IV pilus assembly protein PilM n=1 Tax=Nocardioides psychrotolerans TaxID=1005945 RepID=A0A1I3C0V9_9ACTN|nr:type IV pilus assembly protein PilM [Nocardioides psychrotolerans]GEP36366.1 pilus assembly protein PilM [Nocardioides psychrotolerans]SFH67621.1 type IV pilus assembly protein PilM [Nocardioides psychrotolerans]